MAQPPLKTGPYAYEFAQFIIWDKTFHSHYMKKDTIEL